MWVAAHQLVGHARQRIGDGEVPRFGLELCQEYRLENMIAELLTERGMIVPIDRVEHFVRFLEQEGLQRVDRLFAIAGAPVGPAKRGHDPDESVELFHWIIW